MHFKLFSNCIPVKGITQSIIYDLQLYRFEYIPNVLFGILQLSKEKSIEELKSFYKNEYDTGIDGYFNYLITKEFGFYTSEPDLYPDLDLSWESSFKITNCVLHNNLKIIAELKFSVEVDDLTIILDSFDKEALEYLKRIQHIITYQSIQFFIRYNNNIAHDLQLMSEIKIHPQLLIFNCPEDKEELIAGFKVMHVKEDFNLSHDCKVHLNYFSCNVPHFTEAQQFNTYFNRKLYIDPQGNLKNAPNTPMSHGNIKDLQDHNHLMLAINSFDFVKLQKVTKDMIAVCKDCEYRYMCVDDRIPSESAANTWHHKSDCNYNPYTTKWINEI